MPDKFASVAALRGLLLVRISGKFGKGVRARYRVKVAPMKNLEKSHAKQKNRTILGLELRPSLRVF